MVQLDFPVSGTPSPILVVGEASGEKKNAQVRCFVGRAGRTLHRLLEEQVESTAVSVFFGTGSLSAHLEELRENRYLPNSLLLSPLLRDSFSGDFMPRFFAIPHTSPLAWNRNAPDGRKWSDVGKEQVKLLKQFITRGEL